MSRNYLFLTIIFFILIHSSYQQKQTCIYGESDCQPSKYFTFNESKLYSIKNKKGYLCQPSGQFLQLNDPETYINYCLFKFKQIDHGYYTIQVFANEYYLGAENHSDLDNKRVTFYSSAILTTMQYKFEHLREGWYQVRGRSSSKIWTFPNDYGMKSEVYQTSGITEGLNQLFKVEQINE